MKALIVGSLLSVLLLGAASAAQAVTVPMHAQNGSGEDGTATLTQVGPNVLVTLSITKAPPNPQPAHIHQGTCAKLNPAPKYPLSNVAAGKSTTTLKNMKLSSLQTGAYAINVHKSTTDIATYVSCGDIPKAGSM
jgi:Cu/Zn superoxide dismutase